MQSTPSESLSDVFQQGLDARANGSSHSDNPYAAGSAERREWSAGFQATVAPEHDGDLSSGPLCDDKVDAEGEEPVDATDEPRPE